MVLTAAEGLAATHRWLAETRIARDGLRLALPPSMADIGLEDCVALPDGTTWRVDRAELAEARMIEAVRVESGVYESFDFSEEKALLAPVSAPVPPYPVFLDLPLLTGDEEPHQPHLAVAADPYGIPSVLSSNSSRQPNAQTTSRQQGMNQIKPDVL